MEKKLFTTIYGRNLVGELKNIVHRACVEIRPEGMGITWDDVFCGDQV